MYDALTPLRGNITSSTITGGQYFKSEAFQIPAIADAGAKPGCFHPPGKALTTICRDSFGVPHVKTDSRSNGAFTMGYLAAADRKLLIEYGRGAGYVSAMSVPGINAFGLITSARKFTPGADAKKFMNDQIEAFRKPTGTTNTENEAVYQDFVSYVAGVNAWYQQNGTVAEKADIVANPWTVADVIAAYSFIGSIFGASGGREVENSQFLSVLTRKFGATQGLRIFRDMRNSNDPEAQVSSGSKSFKWNSQPTNTTVAGTPGSVLIDEGSKQSTFSRVTGALPDAPRKNYMSNALMVPAKRSTTGKPLAVMGPQLGYFYPEIVMEVDIHGGGYDFRGAVAPVGPYGLIGRGKDYAWSLTSANNDNVDVFLEKLCVPGGGTATRSSKGYEYNGQCVAMKSVTAGNLASTGNGLGDNAAREVTYWETRHGPVSGTVTVGGAPYAIATQRSTRGREAWSARAMADLTLNKVTSPKTFFSTANKFELTFNWHYVDYKNVCNFSSGRLPVRAGGVDSALPTLGTGNYDWKGFITQAQHPQSCNPTYSSSNRASGLILNWNNKPGKDWGAADDEWSYGPLHRVGLFSRLFKLKNNSAAAFTHYEAIAVDVIWARSCCWVVVALREGVHRCEGS
jgi:acyl-homoserine lactone acylase PvdQ